METIVNAITACRVFVLIFSKAANHSNHVRIEVERAVSKGKVIVPFRTEDAVPSGAMEYCLSNTQWLDAMSPPIGSHMQRLADTIGNLLEQPCDADKPASAIETPRQSVPSMLHPRGIWFGAAVLLIVTIVGVVWWRMGPAEDQSVALAAERTLTYWLTIQHDGKTIPATRRETFNTGDAFFFNATPAQEGALYLFNEGTSRNWHVLFPTRENNRGNPWLAASQSIKTNENPFTDETGKEEGTEKVWLVWAAQPIPLLDEIVEQAVDADFTVRDSSQQAAALRQFMAEYGTSAPEVIPVGEKVVLKARNEVLVYLLKLEHKIWK